MPKDDRSICGIGKDGNKHTSANDGWAKNDGATHVRRGECKKK